MELRRGGNLVLVIEMFVILGVSSGSKEKGVNGWNYCRRNSHARHTLRRSDLMCVDERCTVAGTAVTTGALEHIWLCMIASSPGSLLAVAAYKTVRNREQEANRPNSN